MRFTQFDGSAGDKPRDPHPRSSPRKIPLIYNFAILTDKKRNTLHTQHYATALDQHIKVQLAMIRTK